MLRLLKLEGQALVLRGVLAIIFGVVALAWPGLTLASLIYFFGAYTFVDGLVALATSFGYLGKWKVWAGFFFEGLVGLIAGIITFFYPGLTGLGLLYIIAFWATIGGIFEIATAIELRKEISNSWLYVLSGIGSVVFGILLVAFPSSGALAVVWMLGAYAVIFGTLLLAMYFSLRDFGREVQHLKA